MTFLRQLTRSILTLCVLTSYLCVPMTGAPAWNDKMNTNVVLDLHSVFHRLTLKQLNLLMSSVNDPNTLRAKLEMLQAQPGTDITDTLVDEAVGKPHDTRQVLVHILGDVEGTSLVQTSPYPGTSQDDEKVDSLPVPVDRIDDQFIQNELELFDSLQTALSDVPLVKLQAIENGIKTKNSVQIKSILVNVQNHFPKLTDDLINRAVKVPALMTLISVVDTLITKQSTVGTDPNPQSAQKSASGKTSPSEVVKPTEPSINKEEVASQDSVKDEESEPRLDDLDDLYHPDYDSGFDDDDLPDPDLKGGEQDQTDNNPSNGNTDAVDTIPEGGEYGRPDEPAPYHTRVKPMWNSYRQWTTWGYYDHSTRAPHEYIHPEYRSTYRSTHYGRSGVFVTLVSVFLMVAGFLLFRKRKVVEQWIGPHLTKVPRSCSNILKV